MIKEFSERFIASKDLIRAKFAKERPGTYRAVLDVILNHITVDAYEPFAIDPQRVHEIDDGDYQGTILFVIAEKGYQPSQYYAVYVGYGSCSGCDTLQSIVGWHGEITEEEVNGLMDLAETITNDIQLIGEAN